jgi:tetratricopeptide (TPR) repeat protein
MRQQRYRGSIRWLIALSCWVAGAALAAGATAPPEAPGKEPGKEKGQVEALIQAANAGERQFKNARPQPAWETSAARKQIQALWEYGREHRTTPDGAKATLETLRSLQNLGRHAELREKVEAIGPREAVWSDVMWVLLQEAVASGNFDPFVTKATWVINNTDDASLRARLWFTIGRVHRESGRPIEAEAAFRKAAETSPDPELAAASNGAIYEMWSLNPGQAAPPFTTGLLTGDPLSLEKLRGKVVLIDFWGSA